MSSSHFLWSSCFRDLSQADKLYILWGACGYIQCPNGLLVHEWPHHPYLAILLGLCQGLVPSRGITGPACLVLLLVQELGRGAIARPFFSPPRCFLGQQICSHSRDCLVVPDNLPGQSLSEKWKDTELQEQCSGVTAKVERRSHGELEKVRRQRKAKASQGAGGTTAWLGCSLKICNQHLFYTDKTMLEYTFAELMSSPNTP